MNLSQPRRCLKQITMIDLLRKLALSLPETSEAPHFHKTSFRVKGKIFITYDSNDNKACFMLSLIDQNVFSLIDRSMIYPVPNKWGKGGATFFELDAISEEILADAIITAYCHKAPKALADQVRQPPATDE
jgi:hypothetical protein